MLLRTLMTGGLSLALLAGCAQMHKNLETFPQLFNPKVNVTEYNYGAADALIGQAKSSLSLNMPISIGVLQPVNLKPNEKTPPFGKVTADQIGTRLVQLGYNVRDTGLTVSEATQTNEREWIERGQESGADALITGNYTISDYDVLVNLRLIGLKNGRVLAATDYRMPLGSDTYQLLNRNAFFGGSRPVNSKDGVQVITAPRLPPVEVTAEPLGQPVQIVPLK
jgi:TolB-like protein